MNVLKSMYVCERREAVSSAHSSKEQEGLALFSTDSAECSNKQSNLLFVDRYVKRFLFVMGFTGSFVSRKKKKSETVLTASVLRKDPKHTSSQSRSLYLPPASWHLTDKDKFV